MKKLHCGILISLFVLLSSCSEEQLITPSGNSIKIGVIGPMSGAEKILGEDSLEGIRTALHMSPYLDNGDTLELIVEDDQNEPELTIKAFKKLVTTDKAAAVIVLSSSASALAVHKIADQYQVPVLVLLASHPGITRDSRFVSQLCFDNTFQGKVAALFVRDELLIDRVAVFINPDSFHSNSLAQAFISKFRSIEGQITDAIFISGKKYDYQAILSRLREQNVEFLYLPMAVENVLELSEELRKMNWTPEVMTGDGILSSALALQQGKPHQLDGFLTIELYSNTIKATAYGKQIRDVFRSLFETRNSTYPVIGFEGMAILMHAMNRCHDPAESECINSRLQNTVDFEGYMGNITIQANGKTLRPLIVNRIQGNKLELVVKVY